MRRPLGIPWRWWRRAVQLAMLLLFLWLFRRAEYSDAPLLAGGENLFFRLDPLAGAAAMIAARQFIASFWPAMIALAATMLLGRFFCGWVCPLGTLLDHFHRCLRPIARRTNRCFHLAAARPLRYVVLIAVLLAAAVAFPLIGLVDPFCLLTRALAFAVDPQICRTSEAALRWMGNHWGIVGAAPLAKKLHLLPFSPMVFQLTGVSAAILAAIFALELVARRFWCRYLCPLGALVGLAGRWTVLRRKPARACPSCAECATACRMDAVDTGGFSPETCNLCMDCVDFCPQEMVTFTWKQRQSSSPTRASVPRAAGRPAVSARSASPRGVDLSRRSALAGIVAGLGIPGVAAAARLGQEAHRPDPRLLRPPGASDERAFLSACIRCSECMKVCRTNVLQPAVLEAGLEGIFSPRLVPRFIFEQTYCEYNCTLCGQVCPTGALPRLTAEEKHARPTGKAYFDHNLCLPWAEHTSCSRCEEMCPAPEKAIKILRTVMGKDESGQPVEVQLPYVDRDLCVGCGLCECNCTLDGPVAGIRVQRVDARDPGTEFLLK